MNSKKAWAKKEMRQQNIMKLRSALQNCGKAESENVEDIEQQIMDKSRTIEEYLQNVAKVLVHCSSNKVQMQNRPMPGQPAHNSGSMHMPPQQQGPGMQPPMHQIHPSQMNPGMQMDPAMVQGMPPGSVPMGMIPRRQMYNASSVGSPQVQQQQVSPPQQPDEDTMYTMKLVELQKKYIVPLQKLKEKNAQKKSGGSGGEMKRIDEVLDVLMSSRKIKLEVLVYIESVLFKLFNNKGPAASSDASSVERGPPSAEKSAQSQGSVEKTAGQSGVRNTHFCQPLIDGIANHACNSNFFHTVRRTFGPALYSLHGDVTQYPPAKRPKGDPSSTDMLDSEIKRLPTFFKAEVRNRSRGDIEVIVRHAKHAIVPCLTVVIPKKYPEQSPWVKGSRNKMGQIVEKELSNKLITLTMNCTLTQILLYWEFCIKKVMRDRVTKVA